MRIHTTTVKRRGEEFIAEACVYTGTDKGKSSILLVNKRTLNTVRFDVGGACVVGSYNLIYTGTVVSITEKSVVCNEDGKLRRFSHEQFTMMNHDYDAVRIRNHNNTEMQCI